MMKRSPLFFAAVLMTTSLEVTGKMNDSTQDVVMATSIFTPPGDKSLRMDAQAVPLDRILSEEIQTVIDRMIDVATGQRDNTGQKRVMVGLAAPQIGIDKRIILVDMGVDSQKTALGILEAYINPEITWYSDEMVEDREGCYSVDSRVAGAVLRADRIRIRALTRQGVPITAELSGYTARIFQHEVDHLNGIRFPDRIGANGKLHWVEEHEYVGYRNNYQNWARKCPWETWLAMKEGSASAYSIEKQEKKFFIGLELRTNNEECSVAMPAHKERFFQENIYAKIPNKINGDIIALYTDYEDDYTKPYSWILGCEVSSLEELPEGLTSKFIPEARYAVFTTKGSFPEGLIGAWQAVWQANLSRPYTCDFEVYPAGFDPQNNPEVKVYIAIK